MAKRATKSKTSPTNSDKGCLCKNGTYSKECCNGDMIAQGIGQTIEQGDKTINQVFENNNLVRQSVTRHSGNVSSSVSRDNVTRTISRSNG